MVDTEDSSNCLDDSLILMMVWKLFELERGHQMRNCGHCLRHVFLFCLVVFPLDKCLVFSGLGYLKENLFYAYVGNIPSLSSNYLSTIHKRRVMDGRSTLYREGWVTPSICSLVISHVVMLCDGLSLSVCIIVTWVMIRHSLHACLPRKVVEMD